MQPYDDVDTLELRDYLVVLRRRKLTVLLTVVAAVALALAVSFVQTPVYAGEAQLLLQTRPFEDPLDPAGRAPRQIDQVRAHETEIGVMESRSIRQAVEEELGHEPEVTIRSDGQTNLVTIIAESTDPAQAAHVANTYADVYIKTRRQQLVSDLETAIDEVQATITEIEQLGALQGNVEAQQAPYVAQLNDLQLAVRLARTGGSEVVSRAEVPTSPVRPDPVRNGAMAVVLGLVLGVGLAFLREYLDETIATKEALQQAAGGRNVLGLIPIVSGWKNPATPQLVSVSDPRSPAVEAYRTLRTSVQFIGLDRPVKIIQFTSASLGEGKTTTLANLAVVLASAGQRVIVVCCDLRRPRLHEFFGLPNDAGFTSVLLGEVPLAAALQGVPGQPGLAVLSAGPRPPNPSELLASPRTKELLALLKAKADVVLIDSPPVLPVTDGIVLSRIVDATVLVATANMTMRKDVHRSVEMLQQVEAPLVGAVLNGADSGSVYGYGSSYQVRPTNEPDERVGAAQIPTAPSNGDKAKSSPDARGRETSYGPSQGDEQWLFGAGDK